MAINKEHRRQKIKRRVRRNIFGTQERPRLSVFKSNKEIYAQIIDDNAGKTLASASSRVKGVISEKVTKSEQASIIGKKIAEVAKAAGIENVVFDRNGFVYHGRIKSLAEGAREGGLKF